MWIVGKSSHFFPLKTVQASLGGSWSQTENRDEGVKDSGEASDNSRQHQQWRINLLDHIDAVQDEVSHRMDFIERELDGKPFDFNSFCPTRSFNSPN